MISHDIFKKKEQLEENRKVYIENLRNIIIDKICLLINLCSLA